MATVVSNTQAVQKIKDEEEFRNAPGAGQAPAPWSGRSGGADSMGNLPVEYHRSARNARYVVYSYRTPIGWVTREGNCLVPDVGYSRSTGQHQYGTAHAWGIRFRPQRERPYRPSGTGPRSGGW